MADVNANIGVNIDTSDALNQLKSLQRQISQFHQSVAKSSSTAAIAQRDLQKNFINSVNAIQGFSAELRTVRTSAESFTNSLEKNKFSIQQYFRYAASQSKTFGKNFAAEFSTIEKTAIERVKTLQTQYVKMGRDASGAMQAIAIRPTVLNMKDLGTQTAIAAQKQVLFNQLVKQGSTNLLNFGKNTQWAGRQLMVGFTLPLATLGMTAGRVFMDMEKAAIKFKKVYGDLFTAPEETEEAMKAITELGLSYTKYGVAVSDSLNVAADAAAAGFQGVDLQNQTSASLKLSILGQMELQKALETTIALQNAFRISSMDLGSTIDFLNAVENQTVVSLDDITEATPRVATVIQALGGDVKDLAFFLAAMKEGGVNAAQGANALKSGLASLINPTERASEMLMGMGINIRGIVSENAGDLRATVIGFAQALDRLDPMRRAQAIEQLFGKFQFARISALFDNVIRDGSQASRVLDLAGSSVEELASLSEKELGVSAASAMNKFRASIEQVKVALAPIGELFLKIATPFIDFATTALKAFNNLPDAMKQIIGTVITVVGGLGPILLMTFGLINNGIANMIKFFATVRLGYLKMTGQAKGIGDETQYMTQEQLEAAAAAASLDQAHAGLTQRFTSEKTAVDALRDAYSQAAAAGARFAALNPGMMLPGKGIQKFANGGFVSGSGSGDTVPAMLTPGEFVVKKEEAQLFLPLLQAINDGKIPGFANGGIVGSNDKLVDMFGEFAIRLQQKSENMGRKSSKIEDPAEVLSVLATRVGEARGIVPSQAQVSKGKFDSIADEYSGIVSKFVNNLNSEFETTFSSIKNSDERFKNSWLSAGKKVEQEVQKISSDVDKGVVRKTFGLDPDFMGTAPTMPRRAGGTELERARKAAFNLKDTGIRSYNTEQVRGASQAIFERRTGKSAKDMQMGHALGSVEQSLQSVVNDPRASNAIKKAGASLGVFVSSKTVDGIKESTQQSSPSREAYNAGVNIGKGSVDGIKSQTDEAAVAGQQVGQSITSGVTKPATGPRRFSTDPAVMAALNGTSQAQVNTPPREPRRATREADSTAPTEKIWQKSTENVSDFSSRISKAAFGLSALTGIVSAFGLDLGGILPVISGISVALFGLIEISRMLVGTKIAEIAATRLLTAAKAQGAAGDIASAIATGNVANMFKTMFVKGRGLVGFFINIGKVIMSVARAFGLIGLAIAALSIGIPMILDAMKKHEQKISGLGDAAFVAGEKLKAIANVIGFEPTRDPATSVGQVASFTGATDEVVTGAIDVRQSEGFKALIGDGGAYKADLEAIKNASVADAQQALNTLVTQLIATAPKDFDPAKIQQFAAAIAAEAGKTDLDLSLGVSLNPFEAGNADKVISMASSMAQTILDEQAVDLTQVQTHTAMFGVALTQFRGMNTELTAAANNQAASISAFYEQLKTGLINGVISAEEYAVKTEELLSTISSFPEVYGMEVLSQMLQGVGIDPAQVNNIKNLNDKLLVTNALLTKGATINKEDIDAIASGDKDKAAKARLNIEREVARANKVTADSVAKLNKVEEDLANTRLATELSEYLEKAEEEAALKAELAVLGYSAADAQLILNNEMLKGSFLAHQAAGTLSEYNSQLAQFKQIEAQKISVGGGGQKSAFQEAIDSLKEQQKEAKNSITAYAKLRSAGLGVAEASEIAGDSMLAAALASQQVGSRKWNELVAAIRAARAEEEAWLSSTPEGRAEQFAEVYSQVMDVFSAQEAVLEMNNEAATAANRKIIETLEKQIDAYQRRSSELERDLDKIAEKEDEINKAYDEKTKALEAVKKLNQDIINQQKSQLSIADALSRGDISAAASAMQDARAQSAAAQGDAMGTALDAARQSQLEALTQNGKTRAQIEAEIKQIKEAIATIEFGALQNARDAVEAADEALETAKENLTVQGKSKTEWENINTNIEASKANAALYEAEVLTALENAKGLVGEWSKLQDTFTTTHVVNTVTTGSGSTTPTSTTTPGRPLNSRPFVPTAGILTGGPMAFVAKGGYIKPSYMAVGGMAQFAKGTDTVPAMLTPGEFVVRRPMVNKYGSEMFESMNNGTFDGSGPGARPKPVYAMPKRKIAPDNFPKPVFNMPERKMVSNNLFQPVYNLPQKNYSPVGGAMPLNNQSGGVSSPAPNNNSVYNYSLSVNVEGTNANANDIANVVMNKIKTIDSQQVRRQVLR